MNRPSVASAIRKTMLTADPFAKVMQTRDLVRRWRGGELAFAFDMAMPDTPARPQKPELLAPAAMPKRGRGSAHGRLALLHALAHIEFVAIDLALDAAGRFGAEMGREFVDDWLSVAADEAMHFGLLSRRLRTLGSCYGAMPAHDGFWDAARETAHDVAARLAIIPMVLEARALDVTPMTVARFVSAGDERSARILQRIVDDEIRHVRFGTKHFSAVCDKRGESPTVAWKTLVQRHFKGSVKPPFNDSARRSAGLSREMMAGVATL
ncbi:MAG: rhamnosyltransferase [Novosphingobium sp. 28-62-57]|uniref:ferritin-like domain-containing protein n=1 Tax=unclassified Novosphingobium TaxID=2644732 RepID=UPI000BD1561A|nr:MULTISPECIES: ferritin-like domain-containing protein [unclassified Novosphingobium]OYW48058.1 MAG: rhamnosyltransferase [Novosphingobium sp. 12-62-10]OYZ08185.1 MAG: rhamnosyltransferase [Novosphingobium sp. 28-62-57]OZA36135.1 MAG: rhamnosyltransferase [Novosphingobium sp. 17-62-9]HQS70039.1 ferritin-like domain-containing protein [Novosphingobium sp.]